jgi:hypothetical protein
MNKTLSPKKQAKAETAKASYHHGDLRSSLLDAANAMLKEHGIEGLSLRKLADRVGVSRTAPYHHFKDKKTSYCAPLPKKGLNIGNPMPSRYSPKQICRPRISIDSFFKGT